MIYFDWYNIPSSEGLLDCLTLGFFQFSSLVKSVFQNFYESLGSLVDTPLQEKIGSTKVSNSSSRSRRKEDEPTPKTTRSDKRESTPLVKKEYELKTDR